jgi:hypothetical protein
LADASSLPWPARSSCSAASLVALSSRLCRAPATVIFGLTKGRTEHLAKIEVDEDEAEAMVSRDSGL